VITNSELSVARRCRREHYFAYVLGYRSAGDVEALRFGTAWHRGLEALWLGRGLDEAIVAVTDGIEDWAEASRLRVLLVAYDARWGDELRDEVVAVEQAFRAPVINPESGAASRTFELAGKLDVLLERRFVEHKTTSSEIGFGSVYWQTLKLNSQISTYYAGARALGHEVDGCVYDVVRKPALRPSQVPVLDDEGLKIVRDADGQRVRTKTGKWRQTGDSELGYVLETRLETQEEYEQRLLEEISANPDKYFQRGEVVRLESEEREAQLDTWQLARSLREDELAGRYPRNADACRRYSSMCPFFAVCCGEAELADTTRFARLDDVHPELG
jgi:hypothetical protein